MKFLAVICFLCTALTLSADAVLVIKGKGRRTAVKVEERTGISCRVASHNRNVEVAIRPRKDYQSVKITFKVVNDDDLSFTFGGGYTRSDGNKKNNFEWVDCSLLKIDGQELIGPNAGKDGKKVESFFRPKALKAQVKAKRGGKLTVEITLRSTPRKEVKKKELENSKSKRKNRRDKDEEKEKSSAAEKENKTSKPEAQKDSSAKGKDKGKDNSAEEPAAEEEPSGGDEA